MLRPPMLLRLHPHPHHPQITSIIIVNVLLAACSVGGMHYKDSYYYREQLILVEKEELYAHIYIQVSLGSFVYLFLFVCTPLPPLRWYELSLSSPFKKKYIYIYIYTYTYIKM
jgi:hypothetical protein